MNPITWFQRLNNLERGVIVIGIIALAGGASLGVRFGIEQFQHAQVKAKAEQVCSTADGKQVFSLLKEFSGEWDDAYKLAGSTSRMSLPPQIANLQTIRRKVENQSWPECATKAHEHLIGGMDASIDGYIMFLDSDNDESLVGLKFKASEAEFTIFSVELNKLQPKQVSQ
jgi:hypothetical protein